MVRFNAKDYRMLDIMRESKLNTVKTKHNFLVYGNRNNCGALPVELMVAKGNQRLHTAAHKIALILTQNGVPAHVKSGRRNMIGLRMDVRSDLEYVCSLIKMIVHYMEGNLQVPDGYKIPYTKNFHEAQSVGLTSMRPMKLPTSRFDVWA